MWPCRYLLTHTRRFPHFLCTCYSRPQLPPCMRAYVCACVRHTCSCSCVVPAEGPLSLPGQTALSPLDRWPAPSLLLHIPSLHLPLIPFFHHCLPLLRALLRTPQPPLPSSPTSQQPLLTPPPNTYAAVNQDRVKKKASASPTLPASASRERAVAGVRLSRGSGTETLAMKNHRFLRAHNVIIRC